MSLDPTTPGARAGQPALRAAVLRLGGLLGLERREVIAFAEALAGRPWRRCGRAECERILDEYRRLAATIAARRARHRAPDDPAREEVSP